MAVVSGLKKPTPAAFRRPGRGSKPLAKKKYTGVTWLPKFFDGLMLALTNLKSIVCFVSIYPQPVAGDSAVAH